ncbi:MAG: addiction module protein, partial [Planctomycetota bacterium]|nr:addiction module protein [Planctomycetota bacterium]
MNEQQIIGEARKLPADAQRRISEALRQETESEMPPEIKAKWAKILEERRKTYEEGRSKTYTPEESLRLLR